MVAMEGESDGRRVCSGSNNEVVLKLVPVSVIHKVNARVYAIEAYFSVIRNISPPQLRIATSEIVAPAGQWFQRRRDSTSVRAEELHPQNGEVPPRLRCRHAQCRPSVRSLH